jgi:hypothetical protein
MIWLILAAVFGVPAIGLMAWSEWVRRFGPSDHDLYPNMSQADRSRL